MKLTVNSNALIDALSKVSGSVSTNPILPILEGVLFEFINGRLKISATDLETTTITELNAQGEAGECVIPFRILYETIKALENQTVTIEAGETIATVSTANGTYKIGLAVGDFPDIDLVEGEPTEVDFSAAEKVLFATANDDLRPTMTGVYFDSNKLVATDGHRLSLAAMSESGESIIVPKKVLYNLKGYKKLKMSSDRHKVQFVAGDTIFLARLIDGQYPNYKAIIPTNQKKLSISASELLASIKRLSIFSNQTTNQVVLDIKDNQIKVSAEDADFGNAANETLPCQAAFDLKIGFNAKYMIDALNTLDGEKANFEFNEPNTAAVIREGDSLNLLMPLLIK